MPDLAYQIVLYKNGREIMKGQPQTIDINGINNLNQGIPIKGKMALENSLQAGDYVLQLLVRDKRVNNKNSLASKALDFAISASTQ
jgi:hypothetical protein